jgi:NitT/TauT family transport system substrate-binding protein
MVSAIVVLALAGCSSGSAGPIAAKNGTVTLRVGYIPIADCAPLFIGIQKGFFAQQHLKIDPKPAAGGAAIIPALEGGSYDFGFSNATSILLGSSHGLGLRVIGQGVRGGASDRSDFSAILVKNGGPIKSARDLNGKTVAVNTLQSLASLTADASLARRGVNVKSLKFLEVEFPDMAAAVEKGRVDAAWVVEPFVTLGTSQGQHGLVHPFADTSPGLEVSEWVTTDRFLARNGAVAQRFYRAITQANVYAQQHPDAVRKAVLTYTKIPAKVARVMKLPSWGASPNRQSLAMESRLAQRYGFYKTGVDVNALFPSFVH